MLGGASDVEVVGEAADGGDVVDAVSRPAPHVVLMDVRMPVLDGVAATAALARRTRAGRRDADDVRRRRHRARRAARGCRWIPAQHTPPEQIVEAVRRAAAGDPVLSPDVTRNVIAMAAPNHRDVSDPGPAARARMEQLTEREREVALAVSEGLSNAEIGDRLHLSTSTIKATISSAHQARPHQPHPARDPRPRVPPRLTPVLRWCADSNDGKRHRR
jgi:DNA-binding NarL/FixJ family response regulator